MASAADDLWAFAHMDSLGGGGGRRGCVAANTRSLFKKNDFQEFILKKKNVFMKNSSQEKKLYFGVN